MDYSQASRGVEDLQKQRGDRIGTGLGLAYEALMPLLVGVFIRLAPHLRIVLMGFYIRRWACREPKS